MNWPVALKLGRISNLPTVWTNVLAGTVIVGGALDARLPWLVLALSLCYVAGMFLNDAFDRQFDALHRPERPIPRGEVDAATVFRAGYAMLGIGLATLAWVGYGFREGTGWRPLAAGVALAAAIVLYDWRHKQNPVSPALMGLCRMLVYITAGYAFAVDPPGRVFGVGLLLLCYLMGVTYIARQEHLGSVANLWPLLFLALPVLWAVRASFDRSMLAAVTVLFFAWVVYSLWFLRRRGPGDVPRAVGSLLAGICLWDAVVIATDGRWSLVAVALASFGLTLLLQRYVSPT